LAYVKILFLTHYYPPEVNAPANRVHEHARCWVKEGHEVTVITGVPNHPRGVLFPGYENRWRQEEWMDGVRVFRTWMYVTANEGFFRRTLSHALFGLTAIWAALRSKQPDILIATSPQFFCGLAGAIAARLKRCPFVLEVRDLWPESIVALGQLRQPTLRRLLERLETALYRSAAGIVVVTQAFVDHIEARGIPRDRLRIIYNGIDTSRFHPRSRDEALLRQHGLEEKFLVAYVGTLGLAHGLGTLIDAAERLAGAEEMRFLLIGDGADRGRLEAKARQRGLSNLSFLGLRPRSEIPAWLASIEVLVVMLRDLPVFETVIPSKIFEFLAQERCVVVAAKGEIRRLVSEADAAFVIDPEDPAQLAEAILEIQRRPEEARRRARLGLAWVERSFVRDKLAREMLEFLDRVGQGKA
jgi:colanic acid biosynthesis glycosyl transferase WcaI